MALSGKISDAALEEYLAKQAGVDKVELVEGDPVFMGSFSLVPFGHIGVAQLFTDRAGSVKAVLVPFGLMMNHKAA